MGKRKEGAKYSRDSGTRYRLPCFDGRPAPGMISPGRAKPRKHAASRPVKKRPSGPRTGPEGHAAYGPARRMPRPWAKLCPSIAKHNLSVTFVKFRPLFFRAQETLADPAV